MRKTGWILGGAAGAALAAAGVFDLMARKHRKADGIQGDESDQHETGMTPADGDGTGVPLTGEVDGATGV